MVADAEEFSGRHLHTAPAFSRYLLALFPNSKEIELTKAMDATRSYTQYMGERKDMAHFEQQTLEKIDPEDMAQVLNAADTYLEGADNFLSGEEKKRALAKYSMIYSWLENHLKKVGPNSPERHYILAKMAEAILTYQDNEKYVRAAAYLEDVLSRFGDDQEEIEVQPNNFETLFLEKSEVLVLKAALAVYQGNFDYALHCLQNANYMSDTFMMACRSQMLNPDLPKKFIKRAGTLTSSMLTKLFLVDMVLTINFTKNKWGLKYMSQLFDEQFRTVFLKKHPIVKAKLKKLFAKIETPDSENEDHDG